MNYKRIKCVALAATIVLSGVLSNNLDAQASGKWVETEEGWAYVYDSGAYARSYGYDSYIDGWKITTGIREGEKCNWYEDSKGWWYGDSSGWFAKDTMISIDGKLCCFDSDGYLVTGWKKDESGWRYYFGQSEWKYRIDNEGYATGDQWIDGYWIDSDGYQTYEPRAQWYKDSNGWYYMDSSGYYIKDKTVDIDGLSYTFDKYGYLKKYTTIDMDYSTRTVITFSVDTKNKKKANEQLNNMLTRFVLNGKSVTCNVNGKKRKMSNKKDKIFLGKDSLTNYIKKNSKVEISFVTDGKTIDNYLFSMDSEKNDEYSYKVTFGGVTFKDFKNIHGNCSFKVNGKTYYRKLVPGFVIEGDITNEEWVRFLVGEGIFLDFGHCSY